MPSSYHIRTLRLITSIAFAFCKQRDVADERPKSLLIEWLDFQKLQSIDTDPADDTVAPTLPFVGRSASNVARSLGFEAARVELCLLLLLQSETHQQNTSASTRTSHPP